MNEEMTNRKHLRLAVMGAFGLVFILVYIVGYLVLFDVPGVYRKAYRPASGDGVPAYRKNVEDLEAQLRVLRDPPRSDRDQAAIDRVEEELEQARRQLRYARRLVQNFVLAPLVLASGLILAGLTLFWNFRRYAQPFFELSREEAAELIWYLLFDIRRIPPTRPILRVQDGRASLESPAALRKAGGPGYLSIEHNNAVVTSRLGILHRVLGPGFHEIAPFEKVWDVIDLRPQRRDVRVEFMTRDGIPAYCETRMVFQVARRPNADVVMDEPYPFSRQAVVKLATSKYVRSHEGANRISDWTTGITGGALDGVIRDILEQYTLDEFLNPQYWETLDQDPQQVMQATGQEPSLSSRPKSLAELEAQIEAETRAIGRDRGIEVQTVELGPVLPLSETLSEQWLDIWRNKMRNVAASYQNTGRAKQAQAAEKARVKAQVELINGMVDEVKRLTLEHGEVPAQLIVMSYIDVLYSMSGRDPVVQQLMFQQAESLLRIVEAVRDGKSLSLPIFPVTPTSPENLLPPPDNS